MKVKELISKLQELNPESDLTVNMHSGCHGFDNCYEVADVGPSYDDHSAIEIDQGCFCDGHRGTKAYKLATKPQGVSEYWKARQEFHKVIAEQIEQNTRLGSMYDKPEKVQDFVSKEAYAMANRILDSVHRAIEKKIRGEGDK